MQLAAFPRRCSSRLRRRRFSLCATLAAKRRERNAMIRRRFALESASHAPVAQWIEQPPPKGQVGRSIRLWGAKSLKGSIGLLEKRTDLLDQSLELNRLGFEVVAAGGKRLLAALLLYVGCDDDDRDVLRLRLVFQAARRLPAIQPGEPEVHHDEIGEQGLGPTDSLCAIRGDFDLESVEAQALVEREQIV